MLFFHTTSTLQKVNVEISTDQVHVHRLRRGFSALRGADLHEFHWLGVKCCELLLSGVENKF